MTHIGIQLDADDRYYIAGEIVSASHHCITLRCKPQYFGIIKAAHLLHRLSVPEKELFDICIPIQSIAPMPRFYHG